jgi:uncharacterized membrane protein YvbJ
MVSPNFRSKFCPTCGATLMAGYRICRSCGAEIGKSEARKPSRDLHTSQNLRRGAIIVAVSLGINIFLVAAGLTVYATSPVGLIIWGALAFGLFLIGRDVYENFK